MTKISAIDVCVCVCVCVCVHTCVCYPNTKSANDFYGPSFQKNDYGIFPSNTDISIHLIGWLFKSNTGRGEINWEIGIDIYTAVYIK